MEKDRLLLSALEPLPQPSTDASYTSGLGTVADTAIASYVAQLSEITFSFSSLASRLGHISTPRYILRKPSALFHVEMEEVRSSH